jgi:hypothetical protein
MREGARRLFFSLFFSFSQKCRPKIRSDIGTKEKILSTGPLPNNNEKGRILPRVFWNFSTRDKHQHEEQQKDKQDQKGVKKRQRQKNQIEIESK